MFTSPMNAMPWKMPPLRWKEHAAGLIPVHDEDGVAKWLMSMYAFKNYTTI